MVKLIGVDDSGVLPDGARNVLVNAGLATTTPAVSDSKRRVSIIGDSFSSPGYGSNHGHIWHTVAMSHASGILVGNYAENGHTTADAIEGRTQDWGPDPQRAQLTKAKADSSQSVIVCLGYLSLIHI